MASRRSPKAIALLLAPYAAVAAVTVGFAWQNIRVIPRVRPPGTYAPGAFIGDEGELIVMDYPSATPTEITFERGWPLAYQSRIVAFQDSEDDGFQTIPGNAELYQVLRYPPVIAVLGNIAVYLLLVAAVLLVNASGRLRGREAAQPPDGSDAATPSEGGASDDK